MERPSPIAALKAVLPEAVWTEDADRIAPRLSEWRGRWRGETPIMLLPRNTAEVSACVRACAELGLPITTQGGNTGLVGGQIPLGEVLLSTERLTAVRQVSPLDDALTVESGVTLLQAQQAAAEVERLFPLSLAAEGTATVGGVISTNAGGTAVLRYGVMRDLVLGIEAVLPDGRVFKGLRALRKNNTGYDLKQLFIGAEGTLGVVTAATLKLFPVMRSRATAMVGLNDPEAAIRLLALAKSETGGGVDAFELMKRIGIELVLQHIPDTREPLDRPSPWYVLLELASGEPGAAEAALPRVLERALSERLILDAAIAQNAAQAAAFWRLREEQSAGQKPEGPGWKHDVSVPVSQVAAFIDQATAAAESTCTGARVSAFGHVGDGNIHFDVLMPSGGDRAAFEAAREEGSRRIHDIADQLSGSISAEHGLGRLKTAEAARYKDPVELDLQRAVRAALDPRRLMNPGVLF
ncbi:FAD-binding oxidoreductase [Brevundimonas sp. 2R-24]|uniref:FAD-binding oxidoreductase n=1 Tax=Peiella sedimenti TaxID=3061083 RepID=A0ABT8SIL4_9CAUL|nr:FAD-binding oxidoreductase [Caulobacteraceae bacterium XZ-24]